MLRAQWKERDRLLWVRIDAAIEVHEERSRVKQEGERKKREEEEKARRAAEEKKRQEEERKAEQKRREEEEKRKAEEEEQKRKDLEAEAQRRQAEIQARESAEAKERSALGLTTAFEDWKRAREVLKVSPLRLWYHNLWGRHGEHHRGPSRSLSCSPCCGSTDTFQYSFIMRGAGYQP